MDNKFVDGLFIKAPRPNAPDFVKGSISIKREELISWLSHQADEWVNLDVKEGKSGKWYAQINDWKPNGGGGMPQMPTFTPQSAKPLPAFENDSGLDDIPF